LILIVRRIRPSPPWNPRAPHTAMRGCLQGKTLDRHPLSGRPDGRTTAEALSGPSWLERRFLTAWNGYGCSVCRYQSAAERRRCVSVGSDGLRIPFRKRVRVSSSLSATARIAQRTGAANDPLDFLGSLKLEKFNLSRKQTGITALAPSCVFLRGVSSFQSSAQRAAYAQTPAA